MATFASDDEAMTEVSPMMNPTQEPSARGGPVGRAPSHGSTWRGDLDEVAVREGASALRKARKAPQAPYADASSFAVPYPLGDQG